MRPVLLAEAALAIALASLVVRLAPFRTLGRLLGRQMKAPGASEQEVSSIARAIRAWARRLPWRTLCFEQGLAAHYMLRRRRLSSTLYYGAATIDGELKAHVWVKSRSLDVIGCENSDEYALLARFPDEDMVSRGSQKRRYKGP